MLNGWLLRPLPVHAPEQITVLATVLRSHCLRPVKDVPLRSIRTGPTLGPAEGVPVFYDGARQPQLPTENVS